MFQRVKLQMNSCHLCKVVSEEPLRSCGSCKKVSYCSKECQEKDWKVHKSSCPPFIVKESPGKGRGLFATRKIKEGQVILEEDPLIIFRRGRSVAEFANHHYWKLNKDTKDQILRMHDPAKNFKGLDSKIVDELISKDDGRQLWKEAESPELIKIFRIVCHNSFSLKGGDDCGLFSLICLINHSCNPNSRPTWLNGDSKRQQLRALKTIEKDEEINVSYKGEVKFQYGTRDLRRQQLYEAMVFLCQCPECSLEGEALGEKERMREEIREKEEKMKILLRQGSGRAMTATVERLELVKKLDNRITFVFELLQVSKLALESRMLGLSALDPNKFKREALDYAKKFGDADMSIYSDLVDKYGL